MTSCCWRDSRTALKTSTVIAHLGSTFPHQLRMSCIYIYIYRCTFAYRHACKRENSSGGGGYYTKQNNAAASSGRRHYGVERRMVFSSLVVSFYYSHLDVA